MLRPPSNRDEMYVDIGMYGVPSREMFDSEKSLRRMEEFIKKTRGFKMMYAESFMSRDEFRTMFDHTLYDRLKSSGILFIIFSSLFRIREKLGCKGNVPEVYDKVNRKSRTGMSLL